MSHARPPSHQVLPTGLAGTCAWHPPCPSLKAAAPCPGHSPTAEICPDVLPQPLAGLQSPAGPSGQLRQRQPYRKPRGTGRDSYLPEASDPGRTLRQAQLQDEPISTTAWSSRERDCFTVPPHAEQSPHGAVCTARREEPKCREHALGVARKAQGQSGGQKGRILQKRGSGRRRQKRREVCRHEPGKVGRGQG